MIAIVDYGLGNIKAFANVYKRLNIPHYFASRESDLLRADKIILPGVGAFDFAVKKLDESGLNASLDYMVRERKTPVLGVCVGMQIMAASSEEGCEQGLGWIEGRVKKLPKLCGEKVCLPLPHMGWNSVKVECDGGLFNGMPVDPRFYFLHSYYFECENPKHSIATANYGVSFTTAVQKENVYGIQCHPEKSHSCGIKLLENFAGL